MTNFVAFVLAILIAAAIAADVMLNDSIALLFMAKKFSDMIEWLAFWR